MPNEQLINQEKDEKTNKLVSRAEKINPNQVKLGLRKKPSSKIKRNMF
jgi:hypothetical protein